MGQPDSSCRKWGLKTAKGSCEQSCFEPRAAPCADYKIVEVIPREVSVIKNYAELEDYERPHVNIEAECCKRAPPMFPDDSNKDCSICAAQNAKTRNNLCSAECRPLKTMLHLEEWTKRPYPKPTYKNCVWLDNETVVGRAFPMKFRFRRFKNKCNDCGRKLYFRDAPTENSNLILLSNCCDVEVYHQKKVDNMHLVPVTTITGLKNFSRKVIAEKSLTNLNKYL
ncbi:uncharacterized protein LOC115634194 [Scaptodrosophila lebanonensis]|uniref:Uncharacterized protein LOC115634194 n=1 Tax=Drosophila lebanonensis TaxID=7225 RepID=A0A6J2UK84_DROLE|nr:uncharacterized protein LOC115634194 [Scaptodrosophila lebanonensis]